MSQPRPFPVASGPLQPDVPILHKSWHNPSWPSNVLNVDNILIYFCDQTNPFYDSKSDNQYLIMQGYSLDRLSKMTGIQYSLVHTCGPLFVIGKHRRHSEVNLQPICYYYVMDGTVYQCPDMYTFVQSRLAQAVNPLREALMQATKFVRFDVNKGYSWEFETEASKSAKTIEEEKEKKAKKSWYQDPYNVRSSQYQWKRTDRLLQMTLHKYPPGGGMVLEGPPASRMEVDPPAPSSVASRQTPQPHRLHSVEPASVNPASINPNLLSSKPATPASNLTNPITPLTGGNISTPGFQSSGPNSHAGPSPIPSRITNASPAMRKNSKAGR